MKKRDTHKQTKTDTKREKLHQEFKDDMKDFKYIGEGTRWYDTAYKSLHWFYSGKKQKIIPPFMKRFLNRKINYLLQLNVHDEHKYYNLEDPIYNLHVPVNEEVNVPALWSIELFPPSELSLLQNSLKQNGWDEKSNIFNNPSHSETLKKSRSNKDYRWWKLVTIHGYDSKLLIPDGIRAKIPSEFEFIELRAIQIGSGLTAVIAMINLKEETSKELNTAWHRHYEPELLPQTPWPRPINRKEAASKNIRLKRSQLHSLTRKWMETNLPGFFSSNQENQPILDLMLLKDLDPTEVPHFETQEIQRSTIEAYDALGLDITEHYQLYSSVLPKLLLSETVAKIYEKEDNTPLWTIWGNQNEVVNSLNNNEFYKIISNGRSDANAIARYVGENIENHFLLLAISSFLEASERIFALSRDNANNEHIEFKPESLKKLRKRLFTISLNITTIKEDVFQFWKHIYNFDRLIDFTLHPSEYQAVKHYKHKIETHTTDYNKLLRKHQKEAFDDLIKADQNYLNILSTITSLAVSEDSSRLGRRALWVSVLSLIVASTTFLFSEIRPDSFLYRLIQYLSSLI